MTSIFVSYAREDEAEARGIAEELERRGATVWWDRDLSSGERYIEAILRQIDLADHVLLVLSRHSAASRWVAFEMGAVRMREERAPGVLRIVHLDDCDVPGFIGERHATSMVREGIGGLARSMGLPEYIDWKRPAGPSDRALTVFRAGAQWMELVNDGEWLTCVLVDAGERRARIQWRVSLEEARAWTAGGDVFVDGPRDDRGWSTFGLGRFREWRWTPALFRAGDGPTPEMSFDTQLRALIAASP